MGYEIFILRKAQKSLKKIPQSDFFQLKKTLLNLSNNPRPNGCKKLTGRNGWRIRVGNYRIIYEIDDKKKEILILHIAHRKDIYKI